MTFTHLRVASAFSAHHGTTRPEALVEAAAALGQDAAAITDRDGLYGAIRHVRACLAAGIDPIVGVALASAPTTHATTNRSTSESSATFVLLAHGRTEGSGWAALCRAISAAHTPKRGAPKDAEPFLSPERLAAFIRDADGLPQLTVVLGHDSDVGHALANGSSAAARELLNRWRDHIGADALALDATCHFAEPGLAGSVRHAASVLELGEQTGIRTILTNAVRYLTPDDALTGDLLDAAHELLPLGEFSPQPNGQAWLKTPRDMRDIAERIAGFAKTDRTAASRLLASTAELADRCRLDPDTDLQWRKPKLPENDAIGLDGDPQEALRRQCQAAVSWRYPDAGSQRLDDIHARLSMELRTIDGFGFASYFLTVADVARLIRDLGVRNQARGSGAGSLVNYLLRVSNVDPIAHGLLFERFLGVARSTLPDIDIDIESARRHEVYRAIFERYGSHRVTLMSMQNKYRARGAVRDAGLALGLADEQIDFVAKNVWRFNARDFREVLDEKPELREIAELVRRDGTLDLLVDLTERLDRLPRHIAMHPCGVILGPSTLLSHTPVQPSGIGLPMSQFDKDDMDEAGLLKLDVLGVRMQSSMAFAVGEVQRIHGAHAAIAGGIPPSAPYAKRDGFVDIDDLPLDDEETFEQIRTTHTLGMFQIESPGQRELIGKLQPTEFEDLIADISLFRPGPMKGNMVSPFLQARHRERVPQLLHPSFRHFLDATFGVVIYHEQVLWIFHTCMGVGLAEGDELRRSMDPSKGSAGGMERVERAFRKLTARNLDERGRRRFTDADIDRVWEVLKGFGSFGFCKAHGAAFALPTYQSAWLKTHYPAEFFAGLLTHDPGMYPRRLLLTEARRIGVPVLPIDVNRSSADFRVEWVAKPPTPQRTAPGMLGIRLALLDVHGMSGAEQSRIIDGRADGDYSSIEDFAERARPSRPLLERLAAVGALDAVAGVAPGATPGAGTGAGRGDVVRRVRELNARKRPRRGAAVEGENALDLDAPPPPLEATGADMSRLDRVRAELDILGMEVTEHVIESYRPILDDLGVVRAARLIDLPSGTRVLVAGIRVATQTPPMRTGKRVVFISLDDGTGCSDTAFFEEAQEQAGPLLFGTQLMMIEGKTRRAGVKAVSIVAERAWDLKVAWREWAIARGLTSPERSGRGARARAPLGS